MKIKKHLTIVLLTCTFASCISKGKTQDTINIKHTDYEFLQTVKFGRTQAFTKPDNKPLQKGLYKATINETSTIFNVSDSGYLHGEKKVYSGTKLHSVSNWANGNFIREYVYSYDSGKLLEESFDSTATIYLYDSITNNWNSKLTMVKVRKEYSTVKGGESNWKMVFSGGPTHAYAIFSFRNGKLGGQNYLNYFYEQYDSRGELVLKEVYNWKLKQKEMTSFTDTIIWKSISRDKNMSWNKDGTISYLPVGETGEDRQVELYKLGKLVKKEVYKNNTKTITEYDNKGKIKSKAVYKLSRVDNEIISPV